MISHEAYNNNFKSSGRKPQTDNNFKSSNISKLSQIDKQVLTRVRPSTSLYEININYVNVMPRACRRASATHVECAERTAARSSRSKWLSTRCFVTVFATPFECRPSNWRDSRLPSQRSSSGVMPRMKNSQTRQPGAQMPQPGPFPTGPCEEGERTHTRDAGKHGTGKANVAARRRRRIYGSKSTRVDCTLQS